MGEFGLRHSIERVSHGLFNDDPEGDGVFVAL